MRPRETDAGPVRPSASPLPDADARRAIGEDLDTTLLVEAAAGTGKTQSLVDRMVALVATGRTTIDRLSAVTFTIRAAAQLKQRFQNGLEAARAKEAEAGRRLALTEALAGIERCFVGTIHAFCARLIRERPVEAGVDPGFREMDEPDDGVARGEAWDRFSESLFFRDDPRLERLIDLGIELSSLEEAYDTLCENSDVALRAEPASAPPDFARSRAETWKFLDAAAQTLPSEPPEGGWSPFAEAVRRAQRLRGLLDPERPADFVAIARSLKPRAEGRSAGALRAGWLRLYDQFLEPALDAWSAYVYPDVLAVLVDARDAYAAWRRREGRLNFQDLLLVARDLLRGHPEVRAALRARFTPILVDEFQDTDPIQAEILFYLTGSDLEERDWKRLSPEPGSLFVTGDPKQSIYRFRRADIETYEIVRRRIQACGGRVVALTANFRSSPEICGWVNDVFARPGFFPNEATAQQAAYVPIRSTREPSDSTAILRVEAAAGGSTERTAEADAARIAEYVAAEVEANRRTPADFLILFRRRKFISNYARALERLGIPYEIGAGSAFERSEDLDALLPFLRAIADPDDPVPLLASLRGPLFGVDDSALYRFVRSGGRFRIRAALPPSTDSRLVRAFELLGEAASATETLPPAAAIGRILNRLGWPALAGARALGDSRAGNLLKVLATARRLSGEGLDFPAIVAELDRLRSESLIEQMSVEPGRRDAVRLLTLHGAKGLEAPVVFLAEPGRENFPARDLCVDRRGEEPQGFLRVSRRFGERGSEDVALPPRWSALQETEQEFEKAEKIRLLYVGATRARDLLVVSVGRWKSGGAAGPWAELDPFLRKDLPAPSRRAPSRPAAAAGDVPREIASFRERREKRRRAASAPSYAVVSVTAVAHPGGERVAREETGRGMQWGRIVHRLLEASMRDAKTEARAYAENLFAEEERPRDDLDAAVALVEAVRASPLWARASRAAQRLVEVPFALSVDPEAIGLPEGSPPTILQGAIDLVFEENGRWILVDYKSDAVSGKLAELTALYTPQIELYRRNWQTLTGRPTTAGLFFVETRQEVWLPDSEEPAATGRAEGPSRRAAPRRN